MSDCTYHEGKKSNGEELAEDSEMASLQLTPWAQSLGEGQLGTAWRGARKAGQEAGELRTGDARVG